MLPEALLTLAEKAALAAGDRLRQGAASFREITFADRHDVKLRADAEAEALIRQILSTGAPALSIIGEEEGGDASLTQGDELYWVVDPLDGTFNYLRNLPQCAVSIGLMRGLQPVLGVIHDFHSNLTYAGGAGLGFRLNRKSRHYGWAASRDQAALATGFPHAMDRSDAAMVDFIRLLAPYKKVRMVGSAALALALVASGQLDIYHEQATRLWDIAAGLALLQGAGGHFHLAPTPSSNPLTFDLWAGGRPAFFPDSLQAHLLSPG